MNLRTLSRALQRLGMRRVRVGGHTPLWYAPSTVHGITSFNDRCPMFLVHKLIRSSIVLDKSLSSFQGLKALNVIAWAGARPRIQPPVMSKA